MAFNGIAYEPHPVSPERKRELNAQGLKVVDARFAPDGYFAELPEPQGDALDLTPDGVAAMDKPELLKLLEARGWDGDKRLGPEKLREALAAIVFIGD